LHVVIANVTTASHGLIITLQPRMRAGHQPLVKIAGNRLDEFVSRNSGTAAGVGFEVLLKQRHSDCAATISASASDDDREHSTSATYSQLRYEQRYLC
jgi:hypothetical protein